MAQLLVRDLDDETIKRLKARAIRQGRSLQKEVKLIIEEAAQQNHAEAWEAVNRFRKRLEKTGRSFSDSVELIREDRDR
jgi:hypothetical protein